MFLTLCSTIPVFLLAAASGAGSDAGEKSAISSPAAEPTTRTVRFHDNGAELTNPDMGWALHYYDNVPRNYGSRLDPGDLLKDWPGLSFLYLRIPWSIIEPEEGRFDWTVLDTPMVRFTARGLKTGFRITCSESWLEYATPKWVKDAGAKGYRFRPGTGIVKDGPFWEPDYDDPIFLDKLDHFLAAFAARYDGRPDVSFVEIGSFGVWGEGHTWASTRKAYPNSTILRHIALYRKHFKKTQLVGMDDFASRPQPLPTWKKGSNVRGFDAVILPAWYGRTFLLSGGLWQSGKKKNRGRLMPFHDAGDRTVRLGTIAFDRKGKSVFTPVAGETPKTVAALGAARFAMTCKEVRHNYATQPHSLKVLLHCLTSRAYTGDVHAFLHLLDPKTGKEEFVFPEEREAPALVRAMVGDGMGLRDDSILVQGGGRAYFHATMAQQFWPRAPVYIESEHYGGSAARGRWGDGTGFLYAIEDYHASYASIHWWPHEFLDKNRELVRKVNRVIGYRFQLTELTWSSVVVLGERFDLKWAWRNAGVAPPYTDYFPAVTLEAEDGGVAAVFVDDAAALRRLPVSLHKPEARAFSRSFRLPLNLAAGKYRVLVSVGDRIGNPIVALPLDGGDGHRRYGVGTCRVTGDFAVRPKSGRITGNTLRLETVWTVHRPLASNTRTFFHVDRSGKLAYAGDGTSKARFHAPGTVAVSATIPLPPLKPGESCTVHAGLWRPDRIGKSDERYTPDAGEPDRRVLLGRVTAAEHDGALHFTPATGPGHNPE